MEFGFAGFVYLFIWSLGDGDFELGMGFSFFALRLIGFGKLKKSVGVVIFTVIFVFRKISSQYLQ